MKILHQFYQNLLNKYLREVILTSLILISFKSFAQDGLYKSFYTLVEDQKTKYNKLINSLLGQEFDSKNLSDIEDITLDENYLNLILQQTPTRYTYLATKDKCSLYDLLAARILRSPNGELQYVIFNYQDGSQKNKKALMEREEFLTKVVQVQCPKVLQFRQYFQNKNLSKTVKNIKIKTPKSYEECLSYMQDFTNDYKAPYLCKITDNITAIPHLEVQLRNLPKSSPRQKQLLQKEIQLAKNQKAILNQEAYKVLTKRCAQLNTPELYCQSYFESSLWRQIHRVSPNSEVLQSFCPQKNSTSCIENLENDSSSCLFSGAQKTFSLSPRPNCKQISRSLKKSRLYYQYSDCPGKTGQENITSMARILNHFNPKPTKEKLNNCELYSTLPFANFALENTTDRSWDVKLCFLDKIIGNERVCYPVVMGAVAGSSLSLPKVVAKIASRLRGYTEDKCQIVSKEDYKPALLQFKSGCHIIKDKKNCNGVNCPFKVMLGEREFDKFSIEAQSIFDFLPKDFINENKSLLKLFSKTTKKTLKKISNMTLFLNTFKQQKNALFVGVGCAEDLLPSFFKMNSLNQCTALSFISDGYYKSKGLYALNTRTAIDHIHAPRIIPWGHIFSAIKRYQNLHPISSWEFYAIY